VTEEIVCAAFTEEVSSQYFLSLEFSREVDKCFLNPSTSLTLILVIV
jgi:hypothetical protein